MPSVYGPNEIPVFKSAVHPGREAEFRATAPPKRIIKEAKKETVMCCTNCGKLGDSEDADMKKCSGVSLSTRVVSRVSMLMTFFFFRIPSAKWCNTALGVYVCSIFFHLLHE